MSTPDQNIASDRKRFSIDKIKHPESLYNMVNYVFKKLKVAGTFSAEFKKLFYEKEIGELYGKGNGNFWKIVLLYLTLFISVGFGIQSKEFFNKQLDNPFVRFLSVPIEGDASTVPELTDSLQAKFLRPENLKRFHLDTIRSLSIGNPLMFSSDYVQIEAYGLADDHHSQMVLDAVCSEDNGYIGRPFTSVEDRSVIVTLDLLKDLYLIDDSREISDLTKNDLPAFVMFKPAGFSDFIPLVVQGVAERLPEKRDFLIPTKFNDYLFSDPTMIFCSPDDPSISFYVNAGLNAEQLKKFVLPYAYSKGIDTSQYNIAIEASSGLHSPVLVSVENSDSLSNFASMLKDAIMQNFSIRDSTILDAYYKEYNTPGEGWAFQATKNYMLVVFKDLKKVKLLNDSLKQYSSDVVTNALNIGSTKQRKGIEMEMSNVNMRFILNIIEIIVISFIFIIGVLAVTSLISFIRVLFEKYFLKIEKNIGTFMAFGINIKIVYSVMLTIYIIITVFISLVLAIGVGLAAEKLMIWTVGNSAQNDLNLFSLWNIWTLVALMAIVGANIIAFRQASKIFRKWPGDIINER